MAKSKSKSKKEQEREKQKNNRLFNKLGNFVQDNLNKLYMNSYYTQPSNKHDLDDVKSKLDSSIDRIITTNRDNTGQSTMSSLYSRAIIKGQGGKVKGENSKSLEELFNDRAIMNDGIMGFINDTNTLYDYDSKIDTVLKYMPKLEEALDCRKDNVLSADHFSKDFINVIDKDIDGDETAHNERIKEIKKRYNFQDLTEEWYDETAKRGEVFVYIVPSKKAIAKLINDKNKGFGAKSSSINLNESCIQSIEEGTKFDMERFEDYDIKSSDLKNCPYNDLKVEIDKSGMIRSIVEKEYRIDKSKKILTEMALSYNPNEDNDNMISVNEALNEVNSMGDENVHTKIKGHFDKTIRDDNLSFANFDDRGQESLISSSSDKKKGKQVIDIPGSIVVTLDHKNVVPIYLKDKCFGYYYIETEGQAPIVNADKMTDPTFSLDGSTDLTSENSLTDQTIKQNNILRYLAAQISNYIDAEFVNTNQDLRDEIYMILKYNEQTNGVRLGKIRVTYIPPDDMEHIYFKMNKETHRGISDLDKALFPATLFSSMYITNCIWSMTRAQDKRVYYVNQSVDTNIAQTLMNTITQIKKGNMNIRQIENINNIMNITGQFNDYVIPKSSNGQPPVEFEVMQGQQIEYKTELMTALEEMAVNSTDVPMEMISMRQSVEYATQLSMSSSKFLRKIYNRQSKYQKPLTRIFNKLYFNEYNENTTHEVKLPPPMFLNITNTNQMITNVNDYSGSIAEIFAGDQPDEVKNYFIRCLNQSNLGSYLDIESIMSILKRAQQEYAKNNNSENGEEE